MGFQKPDLDAAYAVIRRAILEIRSPYNDGFSSMYCKKDLWLLKCWLNESYDDLPRFSGEEDWEKERVMNILKKQSRS